MRVAFCLSLLTCVFAANINNGILNLYKQTYSGLATYYGAEGWGQQGRCSYAPPDMPAVAKLSSIDDLAAINGAQWFDSVTCGMCVRVQGSGVGHGNNPVTGSFIVFIKDVCPKCQAGSVDLGKIGDGVWNVSIQAVQCPVGNGVISYKFQGSSVYYIKLQVRNARMPATYVEIYEPRQKVWFALNNTHDGFWTMDIHQHNFERPVHFPLRVRLSAANGEMIEDSVSTLDNDVEISGTGKQFPLDTNLPY